MSAVSQQVLFIASPVSHLWTDTRFSTPSSQVLEILSVDKILGIFGQWSILALDRKICEIYEMKILERPCRRMTQAYRISILCLCVNHTKTASLLFVSILKKSLN